MLRRMRFAAATGLALVAGACVPNPPTDQGEKVRDLYQLFSIVAAVIFVITAGLIAWSIIRYRASPGDDSLPRQTHKNVGLELVWFAIPQIIVIVLFIASVAALGHVDEEQVEGGVTLEVQGFRWGWRFLYADQNVSVTGDANNPPEIVVPTDQNIAFILTSDDVIHSFYVPKFLIKRDTIPGRDNRFDVTIREEGVYNGECAEFCGLRHGDMNFTIRAVDDQEFESWLADRQGAG
jgi:cytochrome c oxidase subunit II